MCKYNIRPLEEMLNFDGTGGLINKVLPKQYAVRQLIAQEVFRLNKKQI